MLHWLLASTAWYNQKWNEQHCIKKRWFECRQVADETYHSGKMWTMTQKRFTKPAQPTHPQTQECLPARLHACLHACMQACVLACMRSFLDHVRVFCCFPPLGGWFLLSLQSMRSCMHACRHASTSCGIRSTPASCCSE